MTATKQPSPFAQAAPAIIAAGYTVLPLMPRDKAPGQYISGRWQLMQGWNRFRDQKPEPFLQKLWAQHEGGNIGVVCGTPCGPEMELVAIDFDTDDHDILAQLESAIPPSPVRKRGARGHTAFYRAPAGTKGMKFRKGQATICEILSGNAVRQTVLPPSIHPSGAKYVWLGDRTLENTRPEELPALLPDQIEKFTDTLEHICGPSEPMAKPSRQHDSDDSDPFHALNQAALDRLDEWVPLLNLPKLKNKGGRYSAVAFWRPSSSGRPLEVRNPNLSIHRDGIKDFGTDQTYSALDLLMASQGWPLDTAFQWLSEQLGMFQDTWGDVALPQAIVVSEAEVDEPEEDDDDAPPREEEPPIYDASSEPVPGLLGEIAHWILETSRRPNPVLAMGAATAVLGTLIGQRFSGPTLSGTHLYIIGLAGSGTGKDHPLQQIAPLLDAANAGHLLGPGKFMSETAMVNMLERQTVSVCPMDEFGSFLAKMNNRRASTHEAGMSAFLREAWGRSFKTMITPEWGGRPSKAIHAPAMSIFGVSTPEEFYEALTGRDVVNGFLNRFLMLDGDTRIADRDPPLDPLQVPDELAHELVSFYLRVRQNTAEELRAPFNGVKPAIIMAWSAEARKAWEAAKAEIENRAEDPDIGPFWRRTIEIAIRLATIRAAGCYQAEIDRASFEWGLSIASASAQRMYITAQEHMAANERSALRNRILRMMRRRGEASLREVQQFIRSEVDSRTLKDVLLQMVEAGALKCKMPARKSKSGRPPAVIYVAD